MLGYCCCLKLSWYYFSNLIGICSVVVCIDVLLQINGESKIRAIMFIYRRLTSSHKSISVNRNYVAQWDKQNKAECVVSL